MRRLFAITPFLAIIIPLIVGIVSTKWLTINPLIAVGSIVVCIVVTAFLIRHHRVVAYAYGALTVCIGGYLLAFVHTPENTLPNNQKINIVARLDTKPTLSGKWWRSTATIICYRNGDNQITETSERATIYVDSSVKNLNAGYFISCSAYLNEYDRSNGFGKIMADRGVYKYGYVKSYNIHSVAKSETRTLAMWASDLQTKALGRLERLGMSPQNLAIASAMSIGVKDQIPKELRNEYATAGVAHILAVSGLHVGMVFMLINILLYFVPLITRNGHLWKNIVAIALIWLYALVAGASPSIIRATMMFSIGQVAIAMTRTRDPLNVILASATIMLCLNPYYLYDVSFQLSYVATLAIITMLAPLRSALNSRFKAVNIITGLVAVTLVASLCTAPLVGYYFGAIPVAGVIANIPVVILAHIIVLLSLVWIITPVGVATPVVSLLLDKTIELQNSIVSYCAQLPYSSFKVNLSASEVALCYVLILIAAVLLSAKKRYLYGNDNNR